MDFNPHDWTYNRGQKFSKENCIRAYKQIKSNNLRPSAPEDKKKLSNNLLESLSHTLKSKNSNQVSFKNWQPVPTQYGLFHFNKKTNSWMNPYGMTSQSFEELLEMMMEFGFITEYTQTPSTPQLAPPSSILDYEVWGAYFGTIPSWNTESYDTLGVVPMINFTGNFNNGYRVFSDTNGSGLGITAAMTFAATIPESRRVASTYYFWDEAVSWTDSKTDHYKTTADGHTYQGARFLNIWGDVQFQDCKNAFTGILNTLAANNVIIPYFADDKENVNPLYGLQGYNTYYPWSGNNPAQFDGAGNPTALMPYGPDSQLPDARVFAALMDDPRFKGFTNPQTNKTLANSIRDYYKVLSNQPSLTDTIDQIYSRAKGVTLGNDFIAYGYSTTKPYSFFGPGTALTSGQIYDDTLKATSWYGALHQLVHGYYATRMFKETFAGVTAYNGATYSNYENYPVNEDEAFFFRDSNDRPVLNPSFENISGGKPYYGNNGNIIWASWTGITFTSGYVINPTTDRERYTWCGHVESPYTGPGTLVRYANNVLSPNWNREVAYKQFIDDIKDTRHSYRSYPDFWKVHTPWVAAGNETFATNYYLNDAATYLYELMYHLSLHGVMYFIQFAAGFSSTALERFNNALTEYRTQSFNSKARPCSNATGDVNALVDRIVMHEAVTEGVMSGGQLLKSGQYLWRITAPPSAIQEDGSITFVRNGSDADLPATVINPGTNPVEGRGIWIKRSIPTPPSYSVVIP